MCRNNHVIGALIKTIGTVILSINHELLYVSNILFDTEHHCNRFTTIRTVNNQLLATFAGRHMCASIIDFVYANKYVNLKPSSTIIVLTIPGWMVAHVKGPLYIAPSNPRYMSNHDKTAAKKEFAQSCNFYQYSHMYTQSLYSS